MMERLGTESLPFSYFGSYLAVVTDRGEKTDQLYICSLRGKSRRQQRSLKLKIKAGDHLLRYRVEQQSTDQVLLRTDDGYAVLTFADAKRLIVAGNMKHADLLIDTLPKYNFEYNYLLGPETDRYVMVNSYKNLSKYIVYVQSRMATIDLVQHVNYDAKGSEQTATNCSEILIRGIFDHRGTLVIEDVPTNAALPSPTPFHFTSCRQRMQQNFNRFSERFPAVSAHLATYMQAIYILWSCTVRPEGLLQRYAVYSSNHRFPGIWSWDHCFIALGLLYGDDRLAFDQMFAVFDYQDPQGQLPGSVSDSTIRWNFSKPPIHGLIYSLLLQQKPDADRELLSKIYRQIKRQLSFYLTYKDSDHDGIAEYHHGNDSGLDNSTVFQEQAVVDSPDLSAYLIESVQLLEELSKRLANGRQAYWREKKQEMMARFLDFFIIDGLPVARKMRTGTPIYSKSSMPYLSIVLGQLLPKAIRENIIHRLTSDDYWGTYGIASESFNSQQYEADGYWRGPIWAPTTMLFAEGLKRSGCPAKAVELMTRFCAAVEKSGFYENFDARTGKGLRDNGFAWTAAVYIYFRNKIRELASLKK
ncbi:MAG: hypothetical protein LKI94_00060 [Sporolactobacillus sp.]|jgi:glycogen debranching enzyme|nr:hypothetical protein [Sporolactobacillus sp.]